MPERVKFVNRTAAGRLLAPHLTPYRSARPLVLAIPRGGVPVGFEIARALTARLDGIVARRQWARGQPEVAIGAVAPGVTILHDALITEMELSARYVETIAAEQRLEVEHSTQRYRAERPLDIAGRTVVLVDDGLASGSTAAAALASARRQGPRHLIYATPVASAAGLAAMRGHADEVRCLREVAELGMVSDWYEDFSPPGDAEVMALLHHSRPDVRE
jgi:putative phosphoribosyl transferase